MQQIFIAYLRTARRVAPQHGDTQTAATPLHAIYEIAPK